MKQRIKGKKYNAETATRSAEWKGMDNGNPLFSTDESAAGTYLGNQSQKTFKEVY